MFNQTGHDTSFQMVVNAYKFPFVTFGFRVDSIQFQAELFIGVDSKINFRLKFQRIIIWDKIR